MKNDFKPGDLVEVRNHDAEEWGTFRYIGLTESGRFVIEDKRGVVSSWTHCRPEEKTFLLFGRKITEKEANELINKLKQFFAKK